MKALSVFVLFVIVMVCMTVGYRVLPLYEKLELKFFVKRHYRAVLAVIFCVFVLFSLVAGFSIKLF